MKSETLALRKLIDDGNNILSRAKNFLSTAQDRALNALSDKIPDSMKTDGDGVKLVFAGQYSAGKSTLLKVLTGRQDIAIGAGITTSTANSYDWGGITVIDTPGVDTKIHPEHDEITKKAIASADLLVFVTTSELFSSHLAEHFREIAIDGHKAPEMMLVMNKMRRCGNTPEVQKVKKEELRKVTAPYSPEDFRITFTDAKDAENSKKKEDEKQAAHLWKISGIDNLTREMNAFVRDKGLNSKYTTALYTLEQVLQEAIAMQSGNDSDLAGAEEILLQRRRALTETKTDILRSVDAEIQKAVCNIQQTGRDVAAKIHARAEEEVINADLKLAQESVEKMSEQLGKSIEVVIGRQMENLEEKMVAIADSELAKILYPRLMRRIEQASISPETLHNMDTAANYSSKLGKSLIGSSFTPKYSSITQIFRLNQYSGTTIHQAVKSIGNFVGVKFRPWEAVRWTRTIANFGRGLVIIGTLLSFVLQIKESADAKKMEAELCEYRTSVRAGFNEAASTIEMHYSEAANAYVADTISKEIENVDTQLAELRNVHETKDQIFNTLLGLLDDTRKCIKQIHDDTSECSAC